MITPDSSRIWKEMVSSDGKRVTIFFRSAGGFRFRECAETYEPESNGLAAYVYWKETFYSGIYETSADAENEAYSIFGWLKEAVEIETEHEELAVNVGWSIYR